jgi:hypothetical protein
MKRHTAKFGAILLVLTAAALFGTSLAKQPAQSPPSAQPPTDPILGRWNFNEDKSYRRGTERKFIIIEPQGAEYQLTIEQVSENGVKWHYSATTGMKGETVKTFDNEGKPTPQEWRVSREGTNAFVLDWLGVCNLLTKVAHSTVY